MRYLLVRKLFCAICEMHDFNCNVSVACDVTDVCLQKDGRPFRGSGIYRKSVDTISGAGNNEDIRDSYRGRNRSAVSDVD